MPDVVAWPPVFLSASEHTITRPVQRAEGLSGAPYLSQSEPTRTMVTASVSGIGPKGDHGGYIEALKVFLDRKLALVRMTPLPKHWLGLTYGLQELRGKAFPLEWTDEGNDLDWKQQRADLAWTTGAEIIATAGADDWPYVDCTGLPPNRVVAAPSEWVTSNGVTAMVIRTATSDANGEARIYMKDAIPSGLAVIGEQPSRIFEIMNFPRATQPAGQNYGYTFEMIERFQADFGDPIVEVNPWS